MTLSVSIHAPARGATSCPASTPPDVWFQSTRPRGARHPRQAAGAGIIGFQSTRPRGARRGRNLENLQNNAVSIHAPARGATVAPRHAQRGFKFQSTRPRGARRVWRVPETSVGSFNPRAREGRDDMKFQREGALYVSIHAPARGATSLKGDIMPPKKFQSTRPRGARPQKLRTVYFVGEFQSTRPRGARLGIPGYRSTCSAFQSTRPRGARRSVKMDDLCRLRVSIHAPARGATPARCLTPAPAPVSIHAPARGATAAIQMVLNAMAFQSTRPRGARRGRSARWARRRAVSIHAPARGATSRLRVHARSPRVSIHAPARGATSSAALRLSAAAFQSTRPRGARRRSYMASRRLR